MDRQAVCVFDGWGLKETDTVFDGLMLILKLDRAALHMLMDDWRVDGLSRLQILMSSAKSKERAGRRSGI